MTAIGFYGMGRMGVPMAINLVKAGFDITVANRTSSRCAPLVERGCTVALTPRELAAEVDIVITMVADGHAARDVYFGQDGLLAGAHDRLLLIDMSTIGPAAARELAAASAARGLEALDSPVSGSIPAAEAATLVAMVGGASEAFDRCRPVLAAMTREQFFLGPHGSGQVLKVAVNSTIAATNLALSEGLVMAERSGIDRAAAYAVFRNSAITSPFMQYKESAFMDPDSADQYFTVALLQKDVELALELGRDLGVPLLSAAASREGLTLARAFGWGDDDVNRVADGLRSLGRSEISSSTS